MSELERPQDAGELGPGPAHSVRETGPGYQVGQAVLALAGERYDTAPAADIVTVQQLDISKQQASIPGGYGAGSIIPIRSAERGRELARRRWDGVGRAARLGLGDAGANLPDVSARQPLKVVRYLVEQHAMHAADPSAPGSSQSFKHVMGLAYPAPERTEVGPSIGTQVNILDAELARAFLDRRRTE